jgi:hypothetical protein
VSTITKHLTNHKAADYCLFIDAHADYKSGELIFGQRNDGQDLSESIDIVSSSFCQVNIYEMFNSLWASIWDLH